MNVEKERKFLLKYLPKDVWPPKGLKIKQAYIMLEGKQQLRVRITNGQSVLCYKNHLSDTKREEYEYVIPTKDGETLYNNSKLKLEKTRYKTVFDESSEKDSLSVDIDIYPNGLQICEIEYEKEFTNIPDYCGEEITGNTEYSNIHIAKQLSLE